VDDFPFSADPKSPNGVVRERLSRFVADLQILDSAQIVQKHLLMGECYILDRNSRYELSWAISAKYGVRPERVYVVGSGQLGFSIADHKRYRPFSVASDVDVAIVSEHLFDQIWMDVVRYDAQGTDWSPRKQKFRRYLMNGWIRPDALPHADSFPTTMEWWSFFEELSGRLKNGRFKVAAGLYRTAEFLELYQQRSVASCKADLELNR
jgi:hypothetical protein